MHHRIIFAVLLCFVLCCHGDVTTLTDIEFAKPEGHSLKLDLYLPSSSSEASPVVVFIHGGGWKNGSKDRAKKLAGWLVESGFAVAGISYRLTDVAGWPAQINDCYTAIRWLRENAQEYSLDSMNIGVWGTSAGGHLAVLLGTRPFSGEETVSSRVQAVCDWFGPSDLLSMPPNNFSEQYSRHLKKQSIHLLLQVHLHCDLLQDLFFCPLSISHFGNYAQLKF